MRGNVTQMIGASDQQVKAVFAHDPYGKDKTGLTQHVIANWDSRLKFQMAPQDPKTGSYSLGARLMDPKIKRFVGADMYVSAASNMGLQLDPLTGNRYLYAGANPAGLIDDGHGWCLTGHIDVVDNQSRCIRPWEHVPQEVLMFAPGYDCVGLAQGRSGASKGSCAWDVIPTGKFDELGAFVGAVNKLGRIPGSTKALTRYNAEFALGQLMRGGRGKASQIVDFAESQGWKRIQSSTGPIKFVDDKGIDRIVLKKGSPRTPGSGSPHVAIRGAEGQRIDSLGNPVSRRSPGNHTPIDWDL